MESAAAEEPGKNPAIAPAASSPLSRLIELDTAWSLQIHAACQPVPRLLLKALEISGDGRFWFPVPVALLLIPRSPPLTSVLLGLLAGSLLDLLLVGLIKHLVQRPRPVYNKGMHLSFAVDHWSFPSGHSSRVFFVASFLHLTSASLRAAAAAVGCAPLRWEGVLCRYGGEAVELFTLLVLLWSAATSISRVLLGRHFVFDVIAGACLGVFEALFVFYFFNFWVI